MAHFPTNLGGPAAIELAERVDDWSLGVCRLASLEGLGLFKSEACCINILKTLRVWHPQRQRAVLGGDLAHQQSKSSKLCVSESTKVKQMHEGLQTQVRMQ